MIGHGSFSLLHSEASRTFVTSSNLMMVVQLSKRYEIHIQQTINKHALLRIITRSSDNELLEIHVDKKWDAIEAS